MIFNCTDKYQFTTRLRINNKPIEVIDSTQLLGTIIVIDSTKLLGTIIVIDSTKLLGTIITNLSKIYGKVTFQQIVHAFIYANALKLLVNRRVNNYVNMFVGNLRQHKYASQLL